MNNPSRAMKLNLVHYGSNKYDPLKVKPIKNRNWVKPEGGLWASPINTNYGWKEWNEEQDYSDVSIFFKFKYKGNILIINSLQDLKNVSKYFVNNNYVASIDFEKMIRDDIDALFLTEKGEKETRYSYPESLTGWDCESVLIFNIKGIILL